jgi:hypothetical protein
MLKTAGIKATKSALNPSYPVKYHILPIFEKFKAKTMLKSILAALFLLVFTLSPSQVNIQWFQTNTSTGNNTDRAIEMVVDAAGNSYVTGIKWGGSNFDIVTIKYSPTGTLLWERTYNGAGNGLDEGRGIALDAAGHVYVLGWTAGTGNNYNYVTLKYHGVTGTQIWARIFNGTGNSTDDPYDIAVDGNANIFVTGGSVGSGTGEDYATLKYDSAGTQQWVRTYSFTGANIDKAKALAVDASGNCYVTGFSSAGGSNFDYATLKYDPAGTMMWASAHRYNGPGNNDDQATAIAVDNATGNVYITGYSRNIPIVDYDYATLMLNSSGAQQWVMRYGGTAADLDRPTSIALDAAGNCYITGKVKNNGTLEDMTTISYSNSGAQRWINVYNFANNFDEGKALRLDPTGTYLYVSGTSNHPSSNNDFITMKLLTSNGNSVWSIRYTGPGIGGDVNFDLKIDAQENVFVCGQVTNPGSGSDIIVIKYCQLLADAGPDVSICLNASTQLNATAPNAVAWSWTPASGLNSTTIANPVATPTATTTYIVTITNANGCTDSDSVTVTVNPLPGPSINASGPTTFCIGDSVTLSGPNNYNYLWSPGGATTQSILVNTSGTYSLTITDSNTCAAQSTITVTVNPLPTVSAGANDTVCLSQTAQLNASGAQTYAWTPGSTLSDSLIANPQAGMVTTTTYTVVGTDANGCSNTASVTITVMPNPPVPSISWANGTLTCSLAGYSYQWYTMAPATPIPGATSQTYIPTVNDTFFVTIIDNFGCSTSSPVIIITDVGISESAFAMGMNLFPNPNMGQFTLTWNQNYSGNLLFEIFSIEGKMVYQHRDIYGSGQQSENISVMDLDAGLYFIRLSAEQGSGTIKFNLKK